MRYEKTEDENIIKQIETVESEIWIDKLEKQVTDLETQISNTPQKIETEKYPKEILALIAEHNVMLPDNTLLQESLNEKKSLLSELKRL